MPTSASTILPVKCSTSATAAGKPKKNITLISVVDTTTDKKVGDIKIDGDRIESIRLEEKGPRMFVNVYYKGVVAVVDRTKRSVIATWPFPQEGKNFGSMAFDEPDHRLFVHARDPGKFSSLIPIPENSLPRCPARVITMTRFTIRDPPPY